MKKVLLATTALAALAFAGTSHAQEAPISFSGSAEFGFGGVDTDTTTTESDFISNVELDVAFTGTADFGISFSASASLSSDENTIGGDAAFDGFTTVISQEQFGTFSFGDTDDAFDSALQSVDSAGLNDAADFYLAGDGGLDLDNDDGGRILNWDYDFSFAAFHASFQENDGQDPFVPGPDGGDSSVYAFGLDGDFAGWNFGIAYEFGDEGGVEADAFGVSAAGSVGPIDLKGVYSFVDDAATDETNSNFDISAVYNFDPFQIGANYSYQEATDANGYGGWVNYSLGGGLNFTAAVGTQDSDAGDETRYDFGFSFSF